MAKKTNSKSIENGIVSMNIVGVGEVSYEFNTLPQHIKDKLGPFGLDHKLANAGAGKTGQDLKDAMDQAYQALMDGKWKIKVAAPKVTKATIKEKLSSLSQAEAEAAKALLEKLGFSI